MKYKLITSVTSAVLAVALFGSFSSVLAEGASYTIVFESGAGKGTMDSQTMPVGEKTALNANEFEYKVNVSYDTDGGDPIATDVLEYPFTIWSSMSQVSDKATVMANWDITRNDCIEVTHDDTSGIDTLKIQTFGNVWEKMYSSAVYLEPATPYHLSVKYNTDKDIRHLNSSTLMRFTVMSAVNNGSGNDYTAHILGNFVYETEALTGEDEWHTGELTFTTPESGIVYLSTNYGCLADGQTFTIQFKDMKIEKVDSEGSADPEALFFENQAEVGNIGESEGGKFTFTANWNMDKSITLPEPVKACSVFSGWTDGTNTYAAGDKISPVEDIKLTALWEEDLVHDWDEPTYEWSDDHSTCTATRICLNDPTHVETETVDSVRTVTAPTCLEDGLYIYSAKFTNPAFEVQEAQDLGEPATGHNWGDWTVTKKATVTSEGEEQRICKNDPSHKEVRTTAKAKPTATPKPTKTPTKAPAVSIKLNKKDTTLVCGKNETLKATVTGSKSLVIWKSSDTKVASVDKNGKVTAKMAGKTTITATCGGASASCDVTVLYKDVTNKGDFWYSPTNYLTANGVVKGYDKQTLFKPGNMCTRAQMVTFIWRLQGEPAPRAKTCKFSDVKKTDYFYKACIWGNENHIVEGYKDGTFGPQIVCARKHAVTFLWRLAGQPKPSSSKNKFKDVKEKDYFYKATLWASEKKILAGYSDGTFKPDGDCLRRQMVTFLYKYDKFVNGKG